MAILYFDGQVVGLTDAELVVFCDPIEVLEPDHPRRRLVSMLAVYALEIPEGEDPCPYRSSDAHDFARCMLMAPNEFLPLAHWPDHELAERFNVPVDQVAVHRGEMIACKAEHGWTDPVQGPGAL